MYIYICIFTVDILGVGRSVMILPYIYINTKECIYIHSGRNRNSVPSKSASGFMNRTLEPAFKSMQTLGR